MRTIIRFFLFLPALILIWSGSVYGHDIHIPVIVDTDAAADDIRAVAMLLNSGGNDIRLIVTSDGALAPGAGRDAILKLLTHLGAADVRVAAGQDLAADPPAFRTINESLKWPAMEVAAEQTGETAVSAIRNALAAADISTLYICLGPLTNLAGALTADPSLAGKIHRVVYLGGAPGSKAPGWNTERDPEAAAIVFEAGVPVYAMGLAEDRYLPFDFRIYDDICAEKTRAARLLCELHSAPAMQAHMRLNRTGIWDEMPVLYLNRPEAFTFETDQRFPESRRLSGFDAAAVRQTYRKLLGNPGDFHLDARGSVVLNEFPAAPDLFRSDVAPLVDAIIAAHGFEEWKACLLTNELHRHLGTYSIIGAKMGIYARELLEAPFDTLEVISHAGSEPPLSCLNDGLQVSTGASLGRGTITVLQRDSARPAATFLFKNTALTLTLKQAYVERVRSDIRSALDRFGTTSPAYFKHVRELSLRSWLELDRTTMFDVDWRNQESRAGVE